MEFLRRLLDPPPPRPLLWFLVLINLVGAAFGYNWYAAQLSGLPAYTWIVVADSPLSVTGLAVAAFCGCAAAFALGLNFGRPWP